MDLFPISPNAEYSYDRRFNAEHRGTDIMAPRGSLLVAVEPGVAWSTLDPKGGNVVYLEGASTGYRYYYAHLDTWAPALSALGLRVAVSAGDAVGYVGTTGNAAGRPPHLHFQVRSGSLVFDPFDDLAAVDPHRGRARSPAPSSSAPAGPGAAVVWLAILWAARSSRRERVRP